MSALARFLLTRGHMVSGSDRSPGEQGRVLASLGARIVSGHDPVHVNGADLVVVTSAVHIDNPEVQSALSRGIPVVKRAQLLASIFNDRKGIAVAGTHGKTTTSALVGHILDHAGLDPTILVGGISWNLGSNARVGEGEIVVAEADEYDASFLHLRPSIGVITNVEAEHLDFYGSEEAVHEAFATFARGVSGRLVVCADDPAAMTVVGSSRASLSTYGIQRGDWKALDVREESGTSRFTVHHGMDWEECRSQLAGRHNVLNALAALAVAHALAVPLSVALQGVESFRGVQRRMEIKGESAGVIVLDDYGHHPTEIRTTLAAIRERFRRPIRLVFQPHTYSRTKAFLPQFANAFADADTVYLLDIYAARELNTYGVNGGDLARAASEAHADIRYTRDAETTLSRLVQECRPGDIVVTMGAGDVSQLGSRILAHLGAG